MTTDSTRIASAEPSADPSEEDPATASSPLGHVENAVIMLLLVATVCVVAAGVAFRFLLHSPLSWSSEIATDLLIWIAFVGLAIGVREKAHVALDLFEKWLPSSVQRWTDLIPIAAMGIMLTALLTGGMGLTLAGSSEISPSGVPLWITYAAVPVGAGLGLLHLLWRLGALVAKPWVDRSPRVRRWTGKAGSKWGDRS